MSINPVLSLPQAYNLLGILHQGLQPLHCPVQFQAPRENSGHSTLPHSEHPRYSSAKSCSRAEGICTFPASLQTRPAGKQGSDLHSDRRQRGHYHHNVVLAQFSAWLQPKFQGNQHAAWCWCTNTGLMVSPWIPAAVQGGAPSTVCLCLNPPSALTEPPGLWREDSGVRLSNGLCRSRAADAFGHRVSWEHMAPDVIAI